MIGSSVVRKEAKDKVTGATKYNIDYQAPGLLYAKLVVSTEAHARLIKVDTSAAQNAPGVQAVVTGASLTILCGSVIEDRPPLARDKVRYYGEPIAVVVANSEAEAGAAAKLVRVEYDPLPIINSTSAALQPNAALIHENLGQYNKVIEDVYPEADTNIAARINIRKGDMVTGWADSEVTVEADFSLPQSDHIALETRNVVAEIKPDGTVNIHSSSQAPYAIKMQISQYFGIDQGQVVVHVPLVGGGFGGKASVHLEPIAFLATQAVHGQPVKLVNSREEDMISSPCHLGLAAHVKLGANRQGKFTAAEFNFCVDTGAYTDNGPRMTAAMAMNCTGPYQLENVAGEALCIYTNHPFVTSFRGFGHFEYTFAIERAIDKLANALGMDPWEIRFLNAITPGHTSPTQADLDYSNLGNLPLCLEKLKNLIKWDEGIRIELAANKVRAKGISCWWKTSSSPTDAHSGAILTMNMDGTINLSCGAVEIGPGMKTALAQILAEKMHMDIDQIFVHMDVNTRVDPHHWKTVASMTTYMVGNAVLAAADDLIEQLKSIAAIVLRCNSHDLMVAGSKVSSKYNPEIFVPFRDISHGYEYPNGNSIGGQLIGRGTFIMHNLTPLNPVDGSGKPGPGWTVGAQAVEVEYDRTDHTYRLVKAATVLDAGKVINPKIVRGLVTGGMCMGLGAGSREEFITNSSGQVETTSLRTYKVMRIGENPEYVVEFVETPQLDAPFGARGLAEHGIIGMPAALANSLSRASGIELDQLPITPESIWKMSQGERLS